MELWKHQSDAVEKGLRKPGYGVFIDVGGGKTRVAMELLRRRHSRKALVVGTVSALPGWSQEFLRVYGETSGVIQLRGTSSQKAAQLHSYRKVTDPLVFVTNYESAWRGVLRKELYNSKFDHIILDEAHKIKTPSSKVSMFFQYLGRRTPYRLGLTGTPLAERPEDIYALCRTLDPRVFGTRYEDFLEKYTIREWQPGRMAVVDYREVDEYTRRLNAISYTADIDKILGLPPYIDTEVKVFMPPATRKTYAAMKKELLAEFSDGQAAVANNALTKNLRLQQMTSGFVKTDEGIERVLDTAKIDTFGDWLRNMDEPVVVFACYKRDLANIAVECFGAGRQYNEISGSRNDYEALQRPHGKGTRAEFDVLGVQIQAGNSSYDFTHASVVAYYNHPVSLRDYRQSRGRLRRPGQERSVRAFHFIAEDSIDERILHTILDGKGTVVDAFMAELRS